MSEGQSIQVVFTPSGKRGKIPYGKSVLDAARMLGVDLDTVCGGRGICDRCQVDLSVGEFAKLGIHSLADHLSPHSSSEREYFSPDTPPTRRLGCQARLLGDVVIDVPPESQAHRQVVRKRAEVHGIHLNSAIKLHYVEVPEPNMHEPSGDLQRLVDALEFEWGLTELTCDTHLLGQLQSVLRDGDWCVTAAVHYGHRIIGLWPGLKDRVYGLAIDVGSTTIAAHLCDLSTGQVKASSGRMNPQIRFGEDLMSRVSYAMLNPGGEKAMTRVVREAIQGLVEELSREGEVALTDIVDMTLVGNPVMHHLLLDINPVELGGAPFALAVDRAVDTRASELDLNINPGTRVYVLPCIAGHVGADAAAAVLSEAPYDRSELTLVVDVGTNAEIVLGNHRRMVAASSPTGPAFEGAQISGGQRAAPGAIERVRIDRTTLEPRFRVIGSETWSNEPDFADSVRDLGVTGICGSGIIEVVAEMYLAGILRSDGIIRGELAQKTPRIVPQGKTFSYVLYQAGELCITITQNDVRSIQLAKAALHAGCALLMDKLQIDQVERIRLAGAFGSHIDTQYAMVLGLIPDCPLDHVSSAGNAAGTGAIIALLDRDARSEIEDVVCRIQKVETAVEPKFQEYFVDALAIPHRRAPYPHLSKAVALPPKESAGGDGSDSFVPRRRRRRS